MAAKKDKVIESMRGLAMLAMIFIHTVSSSRASFFAKELSNLAQFSVPVFIFCSAYLFFNKTNHTPANITNNFIDYLKKRFSRLLVPYYLYLVFYFSLVMVSSPRSFNFSFVIHHLTLSTQTNDLSWLPLLFIYFTILFPLISFLAKNRRGVLVILTVLSYLSAVYFLFYPSPTNFKFLMWLPWLLMVIPTWLLIYLGKKLTKIKGLIFLMFLILAVTCGIKWLMHQSFSFYLNKYPPNLYYLSYGLITSWWLYTVLKRFSHPPIVVQKLTSFLSQHSYSLFYIHFFFIELFRRLRLVDGWRWEILFIFIFSLSLLTQKIFVYLTPLNIKKRTNDL